MGISVEGNKLAVASRNYIEVFSRSDKLGKTFPERPNFYDSLFIPQAKYFTGITDMHEITFNAGNIWAVNTSFSCIVKMSEDHHFIPVWQPDFITELAPEDRCHLNGLIMEDGKPRYVTMFDMSNEANGWRKSAVDTGVLYDCERQEPLLTGLSMPHSPTRHGNFIFFLQSATGQVMRYNITTKELEQVIQLGSFLRGMAVHGDYLFIGASKMRQSSKTFKDLPITNTSSAGIEIVNHRTNQRVGGLNYRENISEIFEIQVIENMQMPLMLTENDEGYEKCINCGDELNYWLVSEEKETE